MTESFFNPQAEKYKCCFELLHVKTGATLICVLAILLQLTFGYDAVYSEETVSYFWLFAVIANGFMYGTTLFGIIYSKPELIDIVLWGLKFSLFSFIALMLFFFGAHLPSSSVERFCRYLFELPYTKKRDANAAKMEAETCLLHITVQLLVVYCLYDILNKCRKYIADKNTYDKLTLPESKLPPAYQV